MPCTPNRWRRQLISNLVSKPVRDRDLPAQFSRDARSVHARATDRRRGGAGVGGYLFSLFDAEGATGLNIYRMFVAVVGSVVVLVGRGGMRRARRFDPARGSRRASTGLRTNPY
jgi:hypothetical protein